MILAKEQIIEILQRKPNKQYKNKFDNSLLNEYTYNAREQLDVIQTFIKEKTGRDCGEIKEPIGELCPSFINLRIKYGISPMQMIGKGDDLNTMDFAFNKSIYYFYQKYIKE